MTDTEKFEIIKDFVKQYGDPYDSIPELYKMVICNAIDISFDFDGTVDKPLELGTEHLSNIDWVRFEEDEVNQFIDKILFALSRARATYDFFKALKNGDPLEVFKESENLKLLDTGPYRF